MSVILTLQVSGDPKRLEEYAAANPDKLRAVADHAKQHGLIGHRFFGSAEGDTIMVADEWPDQESFQAFFEHARPDIDELMQAAGVTSEPELRFWRTLDTPDKVGWDSGSASAST
jgi:heme-degrading monooxygenase HmoA